MAPFDRFLPLQDKVFEKLFSEAEIAKLTSEDMKAYEKSLKIYRDNQNTMDYAISTAVQKRDVEIAREMKKDGHPVEMIAKYTRLTKEQIKKL